ncbi:MAG TPA: molybdopterin-dependent oxidoreductase [Bacillota bacterium]
MRLTHLFNILFLSLLLRSGLEILGAHPMLYWNDHCTPGSEWLKFSRKRMPGNRPWTAEDEKIPVSPWLALPGRDHLGLGRYWHFVSLIGWVLTGLLYVALLFATPQWRRLIPTSWEVFPAAWDALVTYLRFDIPEAEGVFNPLQQLVYAFVVLILSPLQILTGIAMSPAIAARFPGYARLFGGQQAARSLHFIGLVAFTVFTLIHLGAVVAHGLGHELAKIVLGIAHGATPAQQATATGIAAAALAGIVVVHVWATRVSLRAPRRVQGRLRRITDPVQRALLGRLRSAQRYDRRALSPVLRANGRPPRDAEYRRLLASGFEGWQLEIGGLVRRPLRLTLAELRALPKQVQVTKHVCIQGWTQIAEWGGVRLSTLLEMCLPLPQARYLLFETFDDKWEAPGRGYYYGTLDLATARQDQTLLAYEMNGRPLPEAFGAPLRLRVENQLGYKMAKWVRRITLIEDYRAIGQGQGGWREDMMQYSQEAPI